MGFGEHAEEALRRVGVPSIEVATEWLLSNPDPDITAVPEDEVDEGTPAAAAAGATDSTPAAASVAAAATHDADDEVQSRVLRRYRCAHLFR